MENLHLKIENEIAVLEFDQPDSKVNVLDTPTMKELSDVIDQLSGEAGQKVKALLITSSKKGIFIAGADIKEIEGITTPEEALEKAEKGKEILKRLHDLKILTVAVINGACLGGGLELALACKHRVASFGDSVKIGLPEVKLGVVPGFGGTQRLPRIVGLTRALGMILPGKIISGKDALKNGLVDKLFPENLLFSASVDLATALLNGTEKIKRERKKKLSLRFLEDTVPGRAIVFSQARKNVVKLTKGFYPAPLKAIDVIKRTYGRDIKKGSYLESKAFSELAVTSVSKSLIKVFYLLEDFKKFPWGLADIKPAEIHKCGVLGAGVMGGGIAQLLSFRDIPTRIKDINFESLNTALKTVNGLFKYALKKRKLKKHQVEYKFGLVSPTLTYRGFENTDLVIEAVVEDMGIKRKVFEELSEIAPSSAVLASNTSALSVAKMAEGVKSPERVVGLHFFNPVHRMPLVEIIRAEKTSDQTLATIIGFARKLGKLVIVVKDVPGFLINRILLSYLNEAGFLAMEGMSIERVDKIAKKFGMPMGPVELIDEVGIDVGYKVAEILEDAYGERMKVASILKEVKSKGLLGKKSKEGFYLHKGRKRTPNPDVSYLIGKTHGTKIVSDETALKRMIYVMINEAARCLEENVVDRPETVDIGMITGMGFPPFRAGLLRYADSVGLDNIVKDLKSFRERFGSIRFEPCDLLLRKAEKGEKFYK